MKRILILSLVSIALAGVYYLWEVNHPPTLSAWDLVLEESLLVYERNKNSTPEDVDPLLTTFLPDSLRKTVREIKELLISVHVLGKEEMGAVLYLPVTPPLEDKIASARKSIPSSVERMFEGFTINELPFADKRVVSVVTIENILVISSTSFLVEDVIRLAKAKERRNFIRNNRDLFQFAQMESEGGHLYLNLSQFSKFLNVVLSGKNQNTVLDHFARSGIVDIKKTKQNLLFSGFVVDSLSAGGSFLSLFNQQRPVTITLQRAVSNRTGALIHFGISDFSTWTQARLEFCRSLNIPVLDSLKSLKEIHGFDAANFYPTLSDEMGVCLGGVFSGKIGVIKLRNPKQTLAELRKLRQKNTDIPVENYAQYQIYTSNVPSLPVTLFWPLTNTSMNFYTVTERYLIFAEDLEDLKLFISDMDSENTWGKSAEWNEFLSTSSETNAGIIFDGLNGWPSLHDELEMKWQKWGDSTHFLNTNKGSIQFSRLEKSYYLNANLLFNQKQESTPLEENSSVQEISLPQPIRSSLIVVKNHNTGTSELLAEDESGNLLLFSSKMKNLFTTRIGGKITSAVRQIDFYKNKKLQYIFTTEKSLCLVDRLGNTVTGFPKSIPVTKEIRFLSVVDNDNSKNYNFLISEANGKIALYNLQGNHATGWKDIDLKKELWVSPRMVRENTRDNLVAITNDGIVYVFDKHGTPLAGFPVNLKVRPSGDWAFENSNNQKVITLVSDGGVSIQLDLKGRIVNRSNLVKSSATSRFSLVTAREDQYVIGRIDKKQLAILDNRGNVVFENDNPGSDELVLSYFAGPRGRKLFAYTDMHQDFTYLFDEYGKSVSPRPLENQKTPAILVDKSGTIYVYAVLNNKIRSYRVANKKP